MRLRPGSNSMRQRQGKRPEFGTSVEGALHVGMESHDEGLVDWLAIKQLARYYFL